MLLGFYLLTFYDVIHYVDKQKSQFFIVLNYVKLIILFFLFNATIKLPALLFIRVKITYLHNLQHVAHSHVLLHTSFISHI